MSVPPSYTLLLADDSVTTHRVVALTFAEEGVRVVSVIDGEQALERLKAEKPDIVLADIGLAKVNGYELAAQITGAPAFAGVPVLLLTGAFDTLDEQRVRQSGAAGVLVKPFEPGLVIKRVKELLGFGDTDRPAASGAARMITPPEPPPLRPPTGPRGVGAPPAAPRAARDEARAQTGLSPDTAPVEGQTAGDDYFDRLDAAFDSLDAQLAGRSPQRAAVAPMPPAIARPAPVPVPMPPAAAVPIAPAPEPTPPTPEPVTPTPEPVAAAPAAPAAPVAPAPVAPAPAAPAPVAPAHPPSLAQPPDASFGVASRTAPVAPSAPSAPEHLTMVAASHVADAFESLLAAEQGEARHPHAPVIEISDEVIERIAARVAEHLTQGMLIDTVSQIVGAVTERLVREEIVRIRSRAETNRKT